MPLNVRAAVVHGPNQPFVIEEVQLEGPRAGEVLMQVKTTGLCHSDLHAYEGKVPWQFPAILGHEAAGVIVECGPGVTQFKVGDHVERIGTLVPQYMKNGIVIRVVANKDGLDWFTEYEVNFGNQTIAGFYETQLRLVKAAKDSNC